MFLNLKSSNTRTSILSSKLAPIHTPLEEAPVLDETHAHSIDTQLSQATSEVPWVEYSLTSDHASQELITEIEHLQGSPVDRAAVASRLMADEQNLGFNDLYIKALEEEGVKPLHIEMVRRRQAITHEFITEVMRSGEYGFLLPEGVARVVSKVSGFAYFSPHEIDQIDVETVRNKLAQHRIKQIDKSFHAIPVGVVDKSGALVVAIDQSHSTITATSFYGGMTHQYRIASTRTLQTIYQRYWANSLDLVMQLFEELQRDQHTQEQSSSGTLRRFVLAVMRHACYSRASDIMFSSSASDSGGDLRLKIDGVGQVLTFIPAGLWQRVITFMISSTGASNTLKNGPVDRRFEFEPSDSPEFEEIAHRYAFRIVLLPRDSSDAGSSRVNVVMRILDQQTDTADLSTSGFDAATLAELRDAKDRDSGLVLVVGPTGSGKTTTVYALLNEIDPVQRWIESIENPIEYSRGLWVQNQIKPYSGEGSSSEEEAKGVSVVLKGLLRAAPDVILVGECRKGDTASELLDAALTGHLVFSTVHVNRAADTFSRLRGFGLDMTNVASQTLCVLAQRLVRLLCERCAVEDKRGETLDLFSKLDYLKPSLEGANAQGQVFRPRRAVGCHHCNFMGYRGRRLIYELLKVTPKVRDLIQSGASSWEIAKAGIEAHHTLLANAIKLVALGLTSLDEVKQFGSLLDE